MAGDTKKKTYVLEAQDAFSATFNEFQKQLRGIGNETSALRGHLQGVGSQLDTLGISFRSLFGMVAAGGFAAIIKQTIEAEAGLYRVSKATGMTVESLSSMLPSAKEAGLGLDDMAKLSQKLSKAQVESIDPHSKAAAAMRALGVSATDAAGNLKKPEVMALDVAKAFAKFEDGAGKVAVAQDLMGKAGANALPWMENMAEKGELVAKVTTAQALEAKKFEDMLRQLQARSTGAARDMANGLLPAFNDVLGALRELVGQRDSSVGFWEAIGEVVRFVTVALGGVWNMIQKVGVAFMATGKAIKEIYAGGSWASAIQAIDDGKAKMLALDAEYVDFTANVLKSSKVFGDGAEAFKVAETTKREELKYTGIAHNAANKAYTDEKAALLEKIALVTSGSELDAYRFKLEKEHFKLLGPERKQELIDLELKYLTKKADWELQKQINAGDAEIVAIYEKNRTAISLEINARRDSLAVQKAEYETLGLTAEARAHALLALEREKALRREMDPWQRTQIENDYKERDALIELTKSKTDSLALWGDIADRGSKLFVDLATSGKNAFNVLKNALRDFAKEMLALFARRWLLQLGASVVGGSAGGALASQASSLGSNTLSGAASNYLSNSIIGPALTAANQWGGSLIGASTFTGGASTAVFGNAALTGAGDFVGTGLAGMAGELALAAGATDAFAATIAAAVPVIGWIVAIAAVLYGIFGSKGGGPKNGGSVMQMLSTDGAWSDVRVPGADNGRFFTPDQGDTGLRTAIAAIGSSYAASARALGGTPGSFGFGLGYDNDPHGSAQSHTHAMMTDAAGQIIFDSIKSLDDKAVPGQLQLEAQRMVLKALQETSLPPAIAAIIKTVDAVSATAEQVTGVMQLAASFKILTDTLGDFDLDKIIKGSHQNSADIFQSQSNALVNLARVTPMTTEGISNLTQATLSYKQAAAQTILVLEQVKQQVGDMFGATGRNIRMSTMSSSERYDFLQQETARLYDQLGSATTAEEISRITSLINQDINEAWGLLGPDQQRESQADFLDKLDRVQTRAHDRATELQEKTAKDAKDTLDRVETIMNTAALAMTNAATAIAAAADRNGGGVTVRVIDQTANGVLVVTDGA